MAGRRPTAEEQKQKLLEKKAKLEAEKNGGKSTAGKTVIPPEIKAPIEEKTTEVENKSKKVADPILQGPTISREHSSFQADVKGTVADVEELNLTAPVVDFNAPIEQHEEINQLGQEQAQPEKQAPERGKVTNPSFDEMTPKQKEASAEYLAEQALLAYEALNNLGKNFVKLDDQKQQSQAIDGKFDFAILDVELPLSETTNQTISVRELLDSINNQADQIFVVSEEFKDKARPLLVDILKKKGWGLSPEQQLAALFIEDAAPKVAGIIAIKSSLSQIIKISALHLEQTKKPKPPITSAADQIITDTTNNAANNNDQNPKDTKKGAKGKIDTEIKEPGETK